MQVYGWLQATQYLVSILAMRDNRRNQRSYGETVQENKELTKQIKRKEQERAKINTELSQLYSGVYDIPRPPEIQEIYGWLAYMICRDVVEASVRSHIPTPQLKRLSELHGWDLERKDHYDMVKLQVKKELEEKVLPKQADLATACIQRAMKIATSTLDDETLDEPTKAEVAHKWTEIAMMLQGESQPQVAIPGLSAKANTIFMQLNQSIQEDEVIDVNEG